MAIGSTTQKFDHELGDIYNAEHQIEKALQQMISQASDQRLKNLFQEHLRQTQQQIKRLDQVWSLLGRAAQASDVRRYERHSHRR